MPEVDADLRVRIPLPAAAIGTFDPVERPSGGTNI
jgi:hypothetical protein